MAKMAELHAEGVTDLYSYQQGQIDNKAQIIKKLESLKEFLIDSPDEVITSDRRVEVIEATMNICILSVRGVKVE